MQAHWQAQVELVTEVEREGVKFAGSLTMVNVHIRTVDSNIVVASATIVIMVILIVDWQKR